MEFVLNSDTCNTLRLSSAVGLGFAHLPVSSTNMCAATRNHVKALIYFSTKIMSK